MRNTRVLRTDFSEERFLKKLGIDNENTLALVRIEIAEFHGTGTPGTVKIIRVDTLEEVK